MTTTPQEVSVPIVPQRVRRLDGTYSVRASSSGDAGEGRSIVSVVVDGDSTVVDADSDGDWVALYTGGTAHDLETMGMAVALIAPLSAAGIPIFVTSTLSADLVLVPTESVERAERALRTAGHIVEL
ncbi:ACT domain-containing protein [Microbacterium sp. GCS4]|uniref:ACT domain-containing protein n=1 Tax=Microbacterium sp. GCS4 TaxID=1692239 RepID=UPI0013793AC1|nr:ACT domain-containing protein [Microbacterium sp. GCS4]